MATVSTALRGGSGGQGEDEARGPGTHRGVGPPAHAAAVGLGVLDGVRGQVDLQGGGVRVGPVAVGTLVGLVLVVLALVRLRGAQEGVRGQQASPSPSPAYAPFSGNCTCWAGGRWPLTWRLES